jgi:ERCC4-type nuclease
MKLIIDCREKNLIKLCERLLKNSEKFKDKNIVLETSNLDIGDIMISDDKNENKILYERKSISDLLASIKDSRYTEQSYRLNGSEFHNHNIIYIIEGQIDKFSDKQIIFSSMFSLNYYKGFSVFRTFDIEETAYTICNACLKLGKEKNKLSYYKNVSIATSEGDEDVIEMVDNQDDDNNINEKPLKSYSTVVKKKKNENINKENFSEIVLCQIPSVNSTTAIAIMKEFKTINNLIDRLQEDKTCLNNIKYETESKQFRKISKTSISNIINFLVV